MANSHIKRCSARLIIREMQNKPTITCHLTPVRMTVLKKKRDNSAGEGVEKREPSHDVGGSVSWSDHCGKQYGGSSKK